MLFQWLYKERKTKVLTKIIIVMDKNMKRKKKKQMYQGIHGGRCFCDKTNEFDYFAE